MNYMKDNKQSLPSLDNGLETVETGLRGSVEDLNLALKYLSESLDCLQSKAQPLLRSGDADSCNETAIKSLSTKSELRDTLDYHVERVYTATRYINDLTHRLDV